MNCESYKATLVESRPTKILRDTVMRGATFMIVLLSLVDGEEREENLSLESGFIPSSSLILLETKVNRNIFFC